MPVNAFPEGGARIQSKEQVEPLVSIISVVYKDREATRKLIENLSPFRGPDLELVFIDGGSTDGTVELLRANEGHIDYWMSEPDKGIYDAMNKGLKAAKGRWVLHLNAGDELLSVPYIQLRALGNDAEMFACRVVHPEEHFTFVPRMNWTFRFQSTIPHQGTFYRRIVHCGYDQRYRVLGDIAATQRMVRDGHRVRLSEETVAVHHAGGVSYQPGIEAEWPIFVTENYGMLHGRVLLPLFLGARRLYRILRRKIG